MKLPTVIQVDLGASAWALGICGLMALVVVCSTCVILASRSQGHAADVLTAFADVIRALRRRPKRPITPAPSHTEPNQASRIS